MARNAGIHFKYKGQGNKAIERWTKALETQLRDYENDLINKLERVLDFVEETSQRLIPKDTLAATNSFYREVVQEDGKIIARAGYDKQGNLPYIVYIHEFEGLNYTTPGTERRFLAKGFEQASLKIDQILSEE